MERNTGIKMLIACMLLLFIGIVFMLVIVLGNYNFNDYSDNLSEIESKEVTFNDRINEVMQKFDERGIEECLRDLQLSIANKDLDMLESKFKTCKIKANEHTAALKNLGTYATSAADRREMEIINIDIAISKSSIEFVEKSIQFIRKAENNELSESEMDQLILDTREALNSVQSALDALKEYSDTYYYQKYINNPENSEALSYQKGQIDAYQKILSHY